MTNTKKIVLAVALAVILRLQYCGDDPGNVVRQRIGEDAQQDCQNSQDQQRDQHGQIRRFLFKLSIIEIRTGQETLHRNGQ